MEFFTKHPFYVENNDNVSIISKEMIFVSDYKIKDCKNILIEFVNFAGQLVIENCHNITLKNVHCDTMIIKKCDILYVTETCEISKLIADCGNIEIIRSYVGMIKLSTIFASIYFSTVENMINSDIKNCKLTKCFLLSNFFSNTCKYFISRNCGDLKFLSIPNAERVVIEGRNNLIKTYFPKCTYSKINLSKEIYAYSSTP